MTLSLFPYQPRPGQERLMDLVSSSLENRAHLVVESGTGTGKTVCALSACVEHCKARGKKLLYVTRTNSQQRQVMFELRQIRERTPVFGVALQGRRNMCPLMRTDSELSEGSPEELSKVCSERKAKVIKGEEEACKYYATTISEDLQPVMRYAREELPTAEEFVSYCIDRTLCPYEVCKMHIPAADVVTAPYIMFFDGFIRHALMDWMACSLPDIVLIIDEAHNLPSYARELESAQLSNVALRLAGKEVDEYGDPEVSDGISLRDVLMMTEEILDKTVEEYLIDEDGIIPQSQVEEELMFRTKQTSRGIKGMLTQMSNFGEMVRDNKKLVGRLPRSYVHGTANFLTFWQGLDEGEYVKLIVEDGNSRGFEAFCLDASIACRPIAECHASVHMSGTLKPLQEYRESIGLPKDARLADIPSPFPPENRLVLFVDDVTTKHDDIERDDSMVERIAGHISELVSRVHRSTIVFYPSYSLMEKISSRIGPAADGRSVYFEKRAMDQGDFMKVVSDFKLSKGNSLLHAIAGGRVSEGIDFPGEEMELAVLAGIPYPKPTAKQRALEHFCELRFGKGWDHAVKAPTGRKLQQAIGRLIRSETDRGVAVILDKRATHFQDTIAARRTQDAAKEIEQFFETKSSPVPITHAQKVRVKRGLEL
jgi:DNA excision repair protein ERCC-2